jgi:class 3 adenylate cyclase
MDRRLAAIMAADVADYSAHMERDEETTAAQLAACQSLIAEQVAALGGRVFSRAGDAALAEFASPVNAVVCAVEIQKNAAIALQPPSESDRLRLRIGLHLADVIVEGSDLIGDGINIAARIQQAAQPDDVWVSEAIFNQVRRHSPVTFEDMGPHRFKNISEPIRAYRIRGEMGPYRLQVAPTREQPGERPAREGSIAVMPFIVSGADEEQRYLAEGLTDDLIIELARFKQLFVSSRSAGLSYGEKPVDPCRVGRELGVRYVLEGQVRRLRDDVRIALRLTNTETGEAVWVERITRPIAELFDVLEMVTRHVAATVVGRVEAAEIAEARRKPPSDMTAYDCLLRGLEYHRQGDVTVETLRKATEWFDRAIEADPDYGVAYAWRICAAAGLPGFELDRELHFAERALELDPNNAEAHRIMGAIQMQFGSFESAEYHHRRAMELNPSDAYIKARTAAFYIYKGEPMRALQLVEEAQALDPFLPAWCLVQKGIALYALGRYGEASGALFELPHPTLQSRLYQAAAYIALGQLKEARELAQRAIRMNDGMTVARIVADEPYRDSGMREELRRRLIDAGVPAR